MKESIISYIPQDLLRRYIHSPDEVGVEGRILEGSFLMIDISGFTPLLERLAERGREGVEETSDILNTVFSGILDIIYDNGGSVVKFSGDAVICLFRGVRGDIRTASRLQAVKSSLDIMDFIGRYRVMDTLAGEISLNLSIGVNTGRFQEFILGSDERLERILTGVTLEDLVKAQKFAEEGQIVLTKNTINFIEDMIEFEHFKFNKYFNLLSMSDFVEMKIPKKMRLDIEELDEDILRKFIPHRVYEKAVAVSEDMAMMGEHRNTTVLFLNFVDLHRTLEAYNEYFNEVVDIVKKYDGTLAKVDHHTTGDRMMILFGALKTHEDDEERACNCARDIIDILPARFPKLKQRIGISSGYVFAGNIGSLERREYTTIGNIVNMSARLMTGAHFNSINVDERIKEEIGDSFYFDSKTEKKIKGFAEIQSIYLLGDRKRIPHFIEERALLIGREGELDLIEGLLDEVSGDGRGRILSISGVAGIGKSRLTEEVISKAIDRNFRIFTGDCLSYGKNISYHPWRSILRDLFGISQFDTTDIVLDKIESGLESIGKDLWSPILAQFMGYDVEDNEFTATLGAEHKKGTAFNIITGLLEELSQSVPVLIVLEDLHWIDKASQELMEYLFSMLIHSPVLLMMVFRPEFKSEKFEELPNYNFIELTPFDEDDVESLIRSRISMESIPDKLMRIFIDRTRGNPFYVEEILSLMVEDGILVKNDITGLYEVSADLEEVDIPASISDIILTRIDTLTERDKNILKVASVIGRMFLFSILNSVQSIRNDERLKTSLGNFERFDITLLHKSIPEVEYIFKHILTQEVLYSMISYAGRREVHKRVGSYIEENALDLSEQFELLSYHFINAQEWKRGYEYSLKSAQKNAKIYSCSEALEYYKKALKCLDELKKEDEISESDYTIKKYDLLKGIDEQLHILARRDEQRENLEEMEVKAKRIRKPEVMGDFYNRLANYYSLLGEQDNGMEYALKSVEITEGVSGDEILKIRCRSFSIVGKCNWYLQKFEDALKYLNEAYDIAENKGFTPSKLRCLIDIGVVYMNMGDFHRSLDYYSKAHHIMEGDYTDVLLEIEVLGKMGAIYGNLEDYDRAIETLEKHYEMSSEIGARKESLQSLFNLGVASNVMSNYGDVIRYMDEALRLSKDMQFPKGIYNSLHILGKIYNDTGLYEIAEEYIEEMLEIALEIGDKEGEVKYHLVKGLINYERGEYREGFDEAQKSLKLAQEIGNKWLIMTGYHSSALTKLKMGELSEAKEFAETGLDTAKDFEKGKSIASYLYLLSEIERKSGKIDEAKTHIEEAVELMEGRPPSLDIEFEYYKVLKSLKRTEEAENILKKLYDIILERADSIEDDDMTESYLSNNLVVSEIISEYKKVI